LPTDLEWLHHRTVQQEYRLQETIVSAHPANDAPYRPASRTNAACCAILALISLAVAPAFAAQANAATKPAPAKAAKNAAPGKADTPSKTSDGKAEKNAYDYNLPGADGKDVPVSNFKGKFLLIVNLARKSTYNDQLPALIKLADIYKDKGLVVVGIPSNDFGTEEPGTDADIQKAYKDAKVDFPVMAVSKVSGDAALPITTFLTKSKGAPAGGPIHWNYTKFIIDKKGSVIARLSPDVAPDSPEFLATIDQVLDGTYKPAKKGGDKPPSGDDDDDE
jgi:glutathione peroxidase